MTDGAFWTDSHCHLQGPYGPEGDGGVEAVLQRAADAGVRRVVCVGTDVESSRAAVELAARGSALVDIRATVGLHPHEASRGTEGLEALLSMPGADRIVAIGECGLDFFYEHSPKEAQLAALRDQLALAAAHDLAVVLHVRDAFEELFGVLHDVGVPERAIVHCFTGGPEVARRCVEAGMVVSFSGIVTFKNAAEVRAALTEVPLDAMMVETDSPFLAPVPHRGAANEPAFVAVVGEAVARTLDLDVRVLQEATSAVASRVFGGLDRP